MFSASDGEPIPGAQVFLNGTTIGVATLADGSFTLEDIRASSVELVIRSLGFESVSLTLDLQVMDEPLRIQLVEEIYEMDEITITPDKDEWEYNFEVFRNALIGQGPFSDDTRILNEEVLGFDYTVNDTLNELEAFARDKLIIDNDALGYRVEFYLQAFRIDYKRNVQFFAGQTFFIPKESRRKRTNNRWKENRMTAYTGSFVHFTRSLIEGSPEVAGFEVKHEQRKDGARYVSREILPASYYFSRNSEDGTYFYHMRDFYLNVTFTDEYEDETYLDYIRRSFDQNPRTMVDFQRSVFIPLTDTVRVDPTGIVINPDDVLFDGYWGFEKLSDMLPADYQVE